MCKKSPRVLEGLFIRAGTSVHPMDLANSCLWKSVNLFQHSIICGFLAFWHGFPMDSTDDTPFSGKFDKRGDVGHLCSAMSEYFMGKQSSNFSASVSTDRRPIATVESAIRLLEHRFSESHGPCSLSLSESYHPRVLSFCNAHGAHATGLSGISVWW